MLNILIPLGGSSAFFNGENYLFPKPLIEIIGKSMIQHVVENLNQIAVEKKYIFVVKSDDCDKYHLHNVLKLLTDGQCEIVRLAGETKGATCSALMAIDWIDTDDPLIIANADQIIDADLNEILCRLTDLQGGAGVICFESIHPRWSFVMLDEMGRVIEAAEKKPISKNAIAGFYYFRRGVDFVRSAMQSIKKDANIGGLYYIAPVLNELVLGDFTVNMCKIDGAEYHSFYSPQKIKEFEEFKRR